jgi:hypothetical protein
LGLQVAVYRHGELIVDAVAGVADAATGIAFALMKNRLTADFSAATQLVGIVTEAAASR